MGEVNLKHIYRFYTLLLLKQGERHGYEIIERIEKMTGEEPSTSHVYPFLSELREKNYVESEEGARGKKIYSLTEEGSDFVEKKLSSFGEMIDAAVQDRVERCEHCGCEIYSGGYEKEGRMYCCRHCAESVAPQDE